MKKKIKDLTLEEVRKICENKKCENCILFTYLNWYFCKVKNYLDDVLHNSKEIGDEEIEVDEDEKEN